jgi:iron(III) transport system ATP-binding protein
MNESGTEAEHLALSLLEMVQLSSYEKRKPDELSGGEMQRVALVRALASSPDILLLDEPLSALDAKLRRSLRRQIRDIQQKTGITAVYVTHDQEEAMAISDRIVLMDRGIISQTGTPESLYTSPANSFAGGFIGTANMVRIHGASQVNKQILTETEIGSFLLPQSLLENSDMKWQNLNGKMLYFRPEECRIGPADRESITGTGEILYREYGGDFIYLEVRSGNSIIRLKSRMGKTYRRGESVTWSVSPASCRIID